MPGKKGKSGAGERRTEPDFAPKKAHALLRRQLDRLQDLKGRKARDIKPDEDQWIDITGNFVARTFGEPSRQMSQFYDARHAGTHSMMGITEAQNQRNFEERVDNFQAFLENCLEELEVDLPHSKGVYNVGEEFEFYRDLAALVGGARKEVLIVDPYMDEEHFSLYVGRVSPGVTLRVLVDASKMKSAQSALELVAKKFKTGGRSLELRSSQKVHDRVVFVDDRAWITGQSVKDAAKTKPTYIVEFIDSTLLRSSYETIWQSSKVIV